MFQTLNLNLLLSFWVSNIDKNLVILMEDLKLVIQNCIPLWGQRASVCCSSQVENQVNNKLKEIIDELQF